MCFLVNNFWVCLKCKREDRLSGPSRSVSLVLSLSLSLCLAYQKSNIQMQSPFVGPFPLWPVKVYTCRWLRFYLFYDFRKAQFQPLPLSFSLPLYFSPSLFCFLIIFLGSFLIFLRFLRPLY